MATSPRGTSSCVAASSSWVTSASRSRHSRRARSTSWATRPPCSRHRRRRLSWTPSDDVYQLALIALSALAGEVVASYEVCGRLLKSVEADDSFKGWIRDALAARSDRFVDAGEALAALREEPIRAGASASQPSRSPRGVHRQAGHDTFRGPGAAKAAGAVVQAGSTARRRSDRRRTTQPASDRTDCTAPSCYDAHRRIRRGQRIDLFYIDQAKFIRLHRMIRAGVRPKRSPQRRSEWDRTRHSHCS